MVPGQLSYFGGTGGTRKLNYTSAVGTGHSFTYSHEIAESAEVKMAYTASGSVGGTGFETRVCGSVEFHNSNSWGGSKTSKDVAQTETEITLNTASGPVSNAYPFYPVVYNSQVGTLKMAFADPNPAVQDTNQSGYQTYANLYGGLPDPALNLPWRFYSYTITPGQVGWKPTLDTKRKQMRGLFFRKSQVDKTTGTYDFLAFNPTTGDIIRIEPRVYNYSTSKVASNITVAFEAIPYDAGSNSEICTNPINAAAGKYSGLLCPASARTSIGTATIPSLNALQFTCLSGTDDPAVTGCALSVFIDWDTSKFGTAIPGTTQEYRVYVVLKPGGSGGKEIYPPEDPPVAITNVDSTSPLRVTASGHHFTDGDYVIIGGVQGINNANGIFQAENVSGDQFDLNPCEPSPPCASRSIPGGGTYQSGGTATLLDPGQNNEGYGQIGIATPATVTASEAGKVPQDYLTDNSLQATINTETGPQLLGAKGLTTHVDEPLQLRFTAYSSAAHQEAAQVLLFDGDPAQGAPAVAEEVIHPGENGPKGASVWLDWTPTKEGQHPLYAMLIEGGTREVVKLSVNALGAKPSAAATAIQAPAPKRSRRKPRPTPSQQ